MKECTELYDLGLKKRTQEDYMANTTELARRIDSFMIGDRSKLNVDRMAQLARLILRWHREQGC